MKKPLPKGKGEAKVPSPVPLGKGRGKAPSSTLLSPDHLVDYSYIALDDLDNLS